MENYEKIEERILNDIAFKNNLYNKKTKETIDKSIEGILAVLNSINLSIYETNRLVDLVKRIYEAQRMFPQS